MTRVAILDYGSGNLHSVSRAIAHVGGEPVVTGDPHDVADADALVIPGVGHFGACVRAIRDRELVRPIRDFVGTGRSVFGVCVGMQVLFDGSDEDDEKGLGVFPGWVGRLPPHVKVPHMGWNTVRWTSAHPYTDGIADDTRFYFVHSYAPAVEATTSIGVTEHGCRFSAAVSRENVFATQFHPEKSGDAGLHLYENMVKALV